MNDKLIRKMEELKTLPYYDHRFQKIVNSSEKRIFTLKSWAKRAESFETRIKYESAAERLNERLARILCNLE